MFWVITLDKKRKINEKYKVFVFILLNMRLFLANTQQVIDFDKMKKLFADILHFFAESEPGQ